MPILLTAITLCAPLVLGFVGAPVAGAVAEEGTDTLAVSDVYTDQASYKPGSTVTVRVEATGEGRASARLTHLGQTVASAELRREGDEELQWTFTAPDLDGSGYLIEIDAHDSQATTGLDVSSSWTQFPRMGYLDEYPATLDQGTREKIIADLVQQYHLNALQFYDWMWRHEEPIKYEEGQPAHEWVAWNGDRISSETVKGFVDDAHKHNVAALPYSMSYAALAGYQDHGVDPNWGLFYTKNDKRWEFQMTAGDPSTVLSIMNPANGFWRQRMLERYSQQIDVMGFDGTHID